MQIPDYPAMRPLEMADRELLQDIFRQLQPQISELTFANLYLFRKAHAYAVSRVEGSLVIFARGYGGEAYFLPPVSGERWEAARMLLALGHSLYGADEAFLGEQILPAGLRAAEDRDNWDYLYLREELATLPGRRFHKKKNRISYFASRHEFRVEPFSPAHIPGSLELLRKWRETRGGAASPALLLEIEANAEGVQLTEELGLSGVVLLIQGRVAAFALGERLNRESAVCHFEKADPFIEGAPQLVNREFSRLLFNDCTFVNREQDLGEPGLRSAKLSYHPVRMVKKYRVSGA